MRRFTRLETATFGGVRHLQVNVVALAIQFDPFRLEVPADLGEHHAQPFDGVVVQHAAPVLGAKDQKNIDHKQTMESCS